jgi:hypothetical protein
LIRLLRARSTNCLRSRLRVLLVRQFIFEELILVSKVVKNLRGTCKNGW